MAATIDEVIESMQKSASDTNAAKVTIGWETPNCGYMEVVYYAKNRKEGNYGSERRANQ